ERLLDPTRPSASRTGSVPVATAPPPPPPPVSPRPVPDRSAHLPTVTIAARTAAPAPAFEQNLPGFLHHLPAPLRTQGGLIFLAALLALLGLGLVYFILSVTHLI